MNAASKFLVLGAVLAASSSSAFADQISVNGYDSFTNTAISFVGPYSTGGDTEIFAGLNGGTVSFVGGALNCKAAAIYPATQIFTVSKGAQSLTFFATGDTYTIVPYATNNPSQPTDISLTIDGTGFFTSSFFAGQQAGTFTITSQGEPAPNGDSAVVSFSATGTVPTATAVTPEPNSLLLFGTGLLGAVGVIKRRFA